MIVASTPCSDFLSGMVLKWMPCCPVVGQPPMPNSVAEAPFEHENCCCSFFLPYGIQNSNSFTRTSTAKQKDFAQKLLPPAGISGLPCRVCASSQRPTAFLLFTATYTQNCLGAHGELTCYDMALLKRQNETTQQVSFLQQTAQSYHYINIDQLCLDLVLLHPNNHHELLSVLWLLAQGPATTAQTNHPQYFCETHMAPSWLLGRRFEPGTTGTTDCPGGSHRTEKHGDCADDVCVKLQQPSFPADF